MATAAVINTSGESYRSSSRSSYDSDEGTRLKSSVAVVSTRPPTKRTRNDDPQASISRNEGPRRRDEWVEKVDSPEPKKKKEDDILTTKTGGAYIPPARLRMMQEQIQDKSSVQYQRMAWEALKKSINGLINKVNVSNIKEIIRELFGENIIRGRGLLARSIITAQSASPTFSHVYGALVAVVNTKFPQTGELIAKRLIIQFQKGFRRNNKTLCLSSVRFIAHLINQQVLHELLALEILTLLLEDPTNDSVEVAIGFLKECGQMLTEIAPAGIHGVFESLKGILHDGSIDVRVQYMIEVMFAVRKDGFKEHPAVVEGLDLVDEGDQIPHLLSLEEEHNGEDILNVFKPDSEYLDNEEKYKAIKEEILGSDDDESGSEEDSEEESDEEQTAQAEGEIGMNIVDETQTNLLELRRTIYLTIMSSLDFEECAHKIMKMSIKPGQEMEVANMIIECCSEERSYQRFYGLLGERFCHLNEMWVEKFDLAFQEQYSTVHRLETNKLRNAAKFFAQLFYTDALPWTSLACISMNEEDTNSSSRIFVKILFQELAEYMGLQKLNERLKDPFLAESFEGLMPRDNPRNTRFAINFFTSIGLGGLTDDLREHLKNAPKRIMEQQLEVDSSDSSSSEESSSDSGDDSSDDDSSSDDDTTSDVDSSGSETDSSIDKRRMEEERRKMKESRNKEKRYTRTREEMTRNIKHGDKRSRLSKGSRKESDDDHGRRRDSDNQQRRNGSKERRRRHDSEDEHRGRDSDNERKRKRDRDKERRRRKNSEDNHRRRDSDNERKKKRDSNKERRRHDSEDERRGRDSDNERGRKQRRRHNSEDEHRRRDSDNERGRKQRRRHDSEDEHRRRDSDNERGRKRNSDDERRRRHDSDDGDERRRKRMNYEDEQDRRSTTRHHDNGDDTRHSRHRRRYSRERR